MRTIYLVALLAVLMMPPGGVQAEESAWDKTKSGAKETWSGVRQGSKETWAEVTEGDIEVHNQGVPGVQDNLRLGHMRTGAGEVSIESNHAGVVAEWVGADDIRISTFGEGDS